MMLAGALGAVARFSLDSAIQQRGDESYPWGTFWINVSGCLVLGLVIGWVDHHGGARLQTVAGTGFCGAYTTFSTFSVESLRLVEAGRYATAARYVVTSLVAGGVAAAAGLAVAR
ncbi:MAG: fluoride exporter [Frankiales bacterium]|jgi:CrcB protein|nr:fluoride exporter [Frankiales bacterium]